MLIRSGRALAATFILALLVQAGGLSPLLAQEGAADEVVVHVVDSVGDGGDANPADGVCDDGTGACTLRAALEQTNAGLGMGVIVFEISGPGPHSIQPQSPLPAITRHAAILGMTEPDYVDKPVVEIDGRRAGRGADGLLIKADGVVVWGLAINGFDGSGIEVAASWAAIGGNYIGTDVTGAWSRGNGTGITALGPNNYIGGPSPAARNVISGNAGAGIQLVGADVRDVLIEGNFIGTDMTGTKDLGNGAEGIWLSSGAGSSMIGGTIDVASGGPCTGSCNLISGNGGAGIGLLGSSGNVIQGNFIGTDVTGKKHLPNEGIGVAVWCQATANGPCAGGSDNTIGGAYPGAGNLIQGNAFGGVTIIGSGDTTGSSAARNVILGNTIRTNDGAGVWINNAFGNVIGGTEGTTPTSGCNGACNVISGNYGHGVHIQGAGARGNVAKGNYIGTDATGLMADGNAGDGVRLDSAPFNTIGGPTAGAGNVIAGNHGAGVWTSGDGAYANQVSGNAIGMNAAGTAALPNRMGSAQAEGVPGMLAQ